MGGESSLEMTSAITVAAMTRVTMTIATRAMPLKGFFRGSLGDGSGCIPHSRLTLLRYRHTTRLACGVGSLALRSEAVVPISRIDRTVEKHPIH